MSTLQATPRAEPQPRSATSIALAALASLIAIGATILVVVLIGGSGTNTVQSPASSRSYPLIQYHGTGAPPTSTSVVRSQPNAPIRRGALGH